MTDFGVLILTLGILVGGGVAVIGTYIGRRSTHTSEHFFTAGRSVTVSLMTATFIAYAVGTGLIFSPAESAFTTGFTAMIGYALAISVAYVVFIPVSRKIRERIPNGHTIAEYALVRYGRPMQIVTSAVTMTYMFILLVSNLIGAALVFKYMGGVPMIVSVLAIGIPTIYFAAFGGVRAAIAANGIQSLLITPLLILPAAFLMVEVGGPGNVYQGVIDHEPEFMQLAWDGGAQFAIMIILAVTAAELLNQTLWQRIYTARDHKVIRKALGYSAVMVFPMTIVAAFLGLAAIGLGTEVPHTSIVSGMVIFEHTPTWVAAAFSVVVVLAASSTGGDALSGFSALFGIDIVKGIKPDISPKGAVLAGRLGVIGFGICGMALAYQAPSILFLLLLADLLACAMVFPIIAGLYTGRLNGVGAAVASVLGILAGTPMFLAGQSLWSFLTALAISVVVTLLWSTIQKTNYDFDRLVTEITNLD